jgi:serine/threonine-protein kinase
MNGLFKGIGIALLLVLVGVASAIAVIALLLRQEETRVPDLVGKDIVTVVEVLSQQGLQLKVDRRESSPSVAKNSIISQSPPPGTGIKKGRAVRVVVSQGPSELLAPHVTGERYRKAEIILRQAGLPAPDVARTWSDREERDVVIAQDPPAGIPIGKGGKVNILVSLGRKGRLYVTPSLIGKRAEEAARLVDRMGVQHRITSRPSPTGSLTGDQTVVTQRPFPGSPLPADGIVEMEVSR